MISNVAAVETYRSWGVKRARFCPHGFWDEDYDPSLTAEQILTGQRDISVTLMCERLTHWRRQRVDRFALAFPDGVFRGPGWPQGFLPESERVPTLQRTRVGINIHNSTGPINFRTYYLPANGVMQVCDNKSHLGQIYELGKEAVGFDTIDEAIDLCRHYLSHDRERREIAAAGWQRAVTEYNEKACFDRIVSAIEEVQAERASARSSTAALLEHIRVHRHETRVRRALHTVALPLTYPYRQSIRIAVGIRRRLQRWWDTTRYRVGTRST
jgi:spore maturation protein CgeB